MWDTLSVNKGNSIRRTVAENVITSLKSSAPGALIALDDIPDGGLAEAGALIDGEAESLILHRNGSSVRGWLNICPHAGRRLDWAPGKFLVSKAGHLVCAVHGASFSLSDGVCVLGSCRGEALRAVALELRGGMVCLAE